MGKGPYRIKNHGRIVFTVRPFKNDMGQWRYDICYGDSDYAIYTAKSEAQVEAYYNGYIDGEHDALHVEHSQAR